MTDRDELETLRRRAYGPGADIHEDEAALERLRALEQRDAPPRVHAPSEPLHEPLVEPEAEPEPTPRAPGRAVLRVAGLVPPRAWLVAAAALLVLVVCASALTLVQRVQAAPLQPDAEQVARLGVDPLYALPEFFRAQAASDRYRVYEAFEGFRAVVMNGGIYGGSPDDVCLMFSSETDMAAATATSFSGRMLIGCSSGAFPAHVQFSSTMEGFEGGLRSAFPEPTALQVVYDRADDEVVVFAMPVEE